MQKSIWRGGETTKSHLRPQHFTNVGRHSTEGANSDCDGVPVARRSASVSATASIRR